MYQLLPAGMSSEINKTKGTDWLQSARNPPVQVLQRSWIFPPFAGEIFEILDQQCWEWAKVQWPHEN